MSHANQPATSRSSSTRLTLASILSAVGIGSGIYLSNHFYALKAGTQGFKSLCNVSEAMNCDVVALHRLAEVFGGIPLSSFVAGWFVALLIITLVARMETWKKDSLAIATVMSGFGALYSAVLLYVMATQIKTFCLFCLVIDGVNFLAFALFLSMKQGPLFGGFNSARLKNFAGIILVPLLVMIVVLRPAEMNEPGAKVTVDETEADAQAILATKPQAFGEFPAAQIIGPQDAPITIVEFSDFQCPFCRRGAYILNSVLNRYPNEVRVVFRAFPLDNKCNPKGGPAHPYSCMLSRAAICAGEQGKFEEMYQEIFDAQESLSDGTVPEIAKALKLDAEKLKACMETEAVKKAVVASIDEGFAVGVNSTPTFFVNGHRVEGAYPFEVWERVIDALLKK